LTDLAMQLRMYCSNLQYICHGDIYSSCIHKILHTAFFMVIENNGKNAYQLAWAGLIYCALVCEDSVVQGHCTEQWLAHREQH
jgi:hypothetical protein